MQIEVIPEGMTGKKYKKQKLKKPKAIKENKVKTQKKPTIYKGKEYPTQKEAIQQASIDSGISRHAIKARSRLKGISIDEAVAMKCNVNLKPVVVGGVSYESITKACEAIGLNRNRLTWEKRSLGVSCPKEALNIIYNKMYRPKKGVSYLTLGAALKEHGLSRKTYNSRIENGMSEWQALTADFKSAKPRAKNRKSPEIIIKELRFSSVAKFLKYFRHGAGIHGKVIADRAFAGDNPEDLVRGQVHELSALGLMCPDTYRYYSESDIPDGGKPECLRSRTSSIC